MSAKMFSFLTYIEISRILNNFFNFYYYVLHWLVLFAKTDIEISKIHDKRKCALASSLSSTHTIFNMFTNKYINVIRTALRPTTYQ